MTEDARLDADALGVYVGAKGGQQDAYIASCWAQAQELVNGHCGKGIDRVPASVLDRAYIECGAELFHRRATKNGIAQFATPDAQPVRVARDPLVGVYPLVDHYLGPGIG